MTEKEKDRAFLEMAKYLLEKKEEEIDVKTRARLREGRYRAIQSLQSRKNPLVSWMWPATGIAVVCAAGLAFFLLIKDHPRTHDLVSNMEDIELLASSEPIEFYDDLAFYGWLAAHEGAG